MTVHALLRERGAETVEHPGGTLYAHLVRVSDRLARLGAPRHLQVAGLAHAVYGTDGFDVVLVDPGERDVVRAVTGTAAEALVWRYGGCDRKRTWGELAATRRIVSRFTDAAEEPSEAELREFADLTVVNELDVVEQSAELASRHGAALRSLFGTWEPLMSPPVAAEARRTFTAVLGP